MIAYQLKPWTQVVTPHADIISDNIDNATFAASLSQVVRQDPNCPEVYRDARKFFAATYLTKELRNLLEDVLKGLNGQPTDKVLQLRTPFGGGKTHSLVSLYHITQHRQDLSAIAEINNLPDPGIVKVASFIGLDMGAQSGIEVEEGKKILTPWGYLAWQLGGQIAFNLLAEEDIKRIAPGNDILRKIIGDEPTLILLDEFLVYVENARGVTVGDSTFGRQVLTFIQRLSQCQEITSHFLRRQRSWFDNVIPLWTEWSMYNMKRCHFSVRQP
jgi:predicted AAA+ superfamily ATPase